jgi:large subunit ribosomal protein L24e
MEIKICSICGSKIYPGHGSVFVKNNLKLYRFCRSKCRKLFSLKKNPIFLKWTSKNRLIKGRKLMSSFERSKDFDKKFLLKKNYNFYLTLRTLYQYKNREKMYNKRGVDFKLQKKISQQIK